MLTLDCRGRKQLSWSASQVLSRCFSCWSLVNIDNQDWVWGIGLLISGAFIAILAWKYGVEKLRTQEVNAKGADVHLPKAYYTGCMYLIPVW